MKKESILKTTLVVFLISFVGTLYLTKFKSILFGMSFPSYLIFGAIVAVCGLVVYSKEELKSWYSLVTNNYNLNVVPEAIYSFSKSLFLSDEKGAYSFVQNNVHNENLKGFLMRFVDKNTKEEVDEYLDVQKSLLRKKETSAHKIVSNNTLFILFGVVAGYIYDSNIKGLLLIATIASVANILTTKRIEESIAKESLLLSLYSNISNDILSFRNPKYIMYKCENLLLLNDDMFTDVNIPQDVVANSSSPEVSVSTSVRLSESPRQSAVITILNRKSNSSELQDNSKKITS